MTQEYSQGASDIAWFKLAELITRGEKEKVLSFYRLLSHSFPDKAYALQVEGDILWAFDDKDAFHKYAQAAFLYHKESKNIQAMAVYEHMHSLAPQKSEPLLKLLVVYAESDFPERFSQRLKLLLELHQEGKIRAEELEEGMRELVSFFKHQKSEEGRTITFDWVLQQLAHQPALTQRLRKELLRR